MSGQTPPGATSKYHTRKHMKVEGKDASSDAGTRQMIAFNDRIRLTVRLQYMINPASYGGINLLV